MTLGMSRETVKRSDLAGHASYGYCASHSPVDTGASQPVSCATGTGCRSCGTWPTPRSANVRCSAALPDHNHHLILDGQILLADKGLSGKEFKQLISAMGLRLLLPDGKDETYRNGNLGGVRQWIESVNQTLKGQLDLEQHSVRTPHGVFTRVAQRGHGGRHLEQLDDRPDQQTITDRVRSLTPTSRKHSSKTNVKDSATKDR
jgi:hypothetical protein